MSDSIADVTDIDFGKGNGLVPVIVQDAGSRAVLMLGYANETAVELSLRTGKLHFWSRSRQEIWLKGEKSGNFLLIQSLLHDCDADALLALVRPATRETPVCHLGNDTCFAQELPRAEPKA